MKNIILPVSVSSTCITIHLQLLGLEGIILKARVLMIKQFGQIDDVGNNNYAKAHVRATKSRGR